MPLPKLLLVDDHPPNLLALEAVLEGIGADFVRATSGEEALRKLLVDEFALILLDVQMPGLDGFQVAQSIRGREANRTTPIIFLTAIHRDPSQSLRGYDLGAVDYLLKPFDAHVLRAKVAVFLDLFRAKQRIREQEAELRLKERELWRRQGQRRYRDLSDAMAIGVWAADKAGVISLVNRALSEYAGRIPVGVPHAVLLDLVHPDDRERVAATHARMFGDGATGDVTFRLRSRGDEYRSFLEHIVAERDEQGQLTGFVMSLTDIEDLRRAAEEKDAFLAAATHELRTPVAAGQAVLQLALRRLGNGRDVNPVEVLDTVMGQVKRLSKLVDDLLDATRLSRGALPLEISRHDLSAIVRDIHERFVAIEPTRTFVLDAPDSVPFDGDANRLDQVLSNLLANAVRYSSPGSVIETRLVVVDRDEICLSVKDLGIGVPRDKQQAIFGRFARAHGNRYGGLGLGLDIALGIVRQHGGTIAVDSDGIEGRGSVFTVRLPRSTNVALRERRDVGTSAPELPAQQSER